MLTTKNWGAVAVLTVIPFCAVVLFVGCRPPGTHALLEGDRLLREGKYAPAIEKLKVATELVAEGYQSRAWNHLGLACHLAGQYKDAVEAYEHALRLHPNFAMVRYNLGCVYLDQNNLPGAISELTAFTVLEPKFSSAWLKLGAAQLRARQYDAAEKCYQNALQLDPSLPEALNGLGLVQLQRKRWREALTCFNAAVEKHPNYAPALLNLAIIYHQHLPNRQIALRKYRDYLELKPRPLNSAAVEAIAHQIEIELNPPPRVVPTNQSIALPNLAHATNALTNIVLARTSSTSPPSLLASASPPSKTQPPKPSAQTEQPPAPSKPSPEPSIKTDVNPAVLSTPPTNSIAQTPTTPKEEPPPRIDVVTLTNDPAPKLPEDLAAAQPPQTNTPAAAASDASDVSPPPPAPLPPLISKVKPRNSGTRSFLDRLNPRTWFGGREASETSATPGEKEPTANARPETETRPIARPAPIPPSVVSPVPARVPETRYPYRSPAKPAAGDRAKAQPFFSDGLKAHQEQRLTAAMEAYREAVKLDSSYFEAQYNLGLAAYETKDLAQSLFAFENALAIDPASADARYNFALALERAGYFRDASRELASLLAERPAEVKAHFALAKLYADRLAQIDLAREHYRRVLQLDPRHPEATAIRYWLAAHP